MGLLHSECSYKNIVRLVPKGYRKTKAGICPVNWETIKLGDISTFKQGYQIPRSEQVTENSNGYIRFLYISDFFSNNNKLFIKDDPKYYKVSKEDICVANTGNTAGKAFRGVEGVLSNNMFKIFMSDKIDSNFYWQFLNSGNYSGQLRSMFNSGGQPHVGHENMNNIIINIPSLTEQHKIAEILSTWDKAIKNIEQIIGLKTQQKKSLMKKLLNSEVRIPGFTEDWQYLLAGDIFNSISDKSHGGKGVVLSSTQDKGIIPRSEVDVDIKFDIDSLSSYKKINAGEFVISLRSFQGGIEYSEYEGLLSPAYTVLRKKINISEKFYKNLFKSADFITKLSGLIYGIRDGKQISFKDFSVMKLPYPSIEEQNKISEILELASYEIDILEKELNLIQLQKKGIAQLLLNGIVKV